MGPELFRKRWGFVTLCAAPVVLTSTAPALAQTFNANTVMGAVPGALALGAGAFALIALGILRSLKRDGEIMRRDAGTQISGLRALVDEYEALLSATREVTILWSENGSAAKYYGQFGCILPLGRPPETLLDAASWLVTADADSLLKSIEALRVNGHGFELSLMARDGRLVRATGLVLGAGTAVRLRPAFVQPDQQAPTYDALSGARAIASAMTLPAFLRDADNRLVYANRAYGQLARQLGREAGENMPMELVQPEILRQHLASIDQSGTPQVLALDLGSAGAFDLVEVPLHEGKAGYLRAKTAPQIAPLETGLAQLSGIIDALSTPIAIFNATRELVQFNSAYGALWDGAGEWLQLGMDERTVLDRLRTEGRLPSEADYHAWRTRHLESYGLSAPRREPWHLPDGRTIEVLAAPTGVKGGVMYVFEDISARLRLESLNKSMTSVQRESLNALTEGVAVFGTNGRLTLSNPRLSVLWKLPASALDKTPHIDQIASACSKAMPEDGAMIWRDLKRSIIDLNPNRSDTAGRITRADGMLLDYAITRLPDGQTMMTFLDVTESANFQRVLKERNDALITADRLKDAFVQNVSYELRSPLTNIIGFAEILASGEVGSLNERQRAYTDYIRASSVTLGVLIDNILDLATVDAGIADLRPEPQDVSILIDKARAGLAATFPEINGEKLINLVVDLPSQLPQFVADGTRIVQVLYNLLSSAARFSEPGAEIRLSVVPRGERMIFIVEDEGAGMTDEMKAAIMDRADSPATTARQRGAGLGLAIVKTFVNLHGGTISIEKREPRGTRVIVNLPRDAAFVGAAE